MTQVRDDRAVDRQPDQAMRLFDGPVAGWLPSIVGPDEDTWRTQTQEGPVRVYLSVHTRDPWVLADGTHCRALNIQPDRTDFHNLVVAGLTPRVDGELCLAPDTDHSTRLVYKGSTRRRSRLTTALEQLLVGDPLVRSGIDTLLDTIADRLATAPLDPPPDGPRRGPVRVAVPR